MIAIQIACLVPNEVIQAINSSVQRKGVEDPGPRLCVCAGRTKEKGRNGQYLRKAVMTLGK